MLPSPGAPRSTVRPDLCPFRDALCAAGRCSTCSPGASPLSAEDKHERLARLSENPAYSDEDRAIFARAAADLLPVLSGELVHLQEPRRVRAPITAPVEGWPPFVVRALEG